jgi:regulator of sigma E protease
MTFASLGSLLLLIFGFGFVIFWHELGHFLAAKWVGIKVEQFAVGFGQALVSWRKGIGFRLGSTAKEYEERLRAHVREREGLGQTHEFADAESEEDKMYMASRTMDLGETEYRLNWIPLGGYVKMLGQDDLNPNKKSEDPRSYNKKSIPRRMIVVSAGVIMNIILAAIGFMIVFLIGFRVQPPVVGALNPGSPAAKTTREDGSVAPLQVGDRILYFDDKYQHDFTKIVLNVALSGEGKVPMFVERVGGKRESLYITPESSEGRGRFMEIGVDRPVQLRGLDEEDAQAMKDINGPDSMLPREMLLVGPGDVITAVNGEPVKAGTLANSKDDEYWKLDRAVQASHGDPVKLTIKHTDGKLEEVSFLPKFNNPFGAEQLSFGGMVPRTTVSIVTPKSPARGKLFPNDVVLQISYAKGSDPLANPTATDLIDRLSKAGKNGQTVDMLVLRDGREVAVNDLSPNVKVTDDRYGLNIGLGYDDRHAIVAGVQEKSAAAAAGIPLGASVTTINGQPVKSWFDVKRLLGAAVAGTPVKVTATTPTGEKTFDLNFDTTALTQVAGYNYRHDLQLHDRIEPRKTSSPLVAAGWGITETRDFVLQFYLTLHRMFQGRVSYKNMMGPVGIFNAGRHFAYKGTDWLLWFLSMISANLAVVNFLPIPIVDGGLFLFLIIEKIQGRPLSAKTQSIAQVVGLAIIVGVFLLVTYNDVTHNLMR